MTNPTPHGQVPEALRIADEFRECLEWDTIPSIIDIEDAADELRRLHAENEAIRAQQDDAYDHGPQAETVEEAARDVGKWLNERPNRPLDLRHVAMLTHHAKRTAHVQNPAEIEHVAGDVVKDGAEVNTTTAQQPRGAARELELAARAVVAADDAQSLNQNLIERLRAALRTQQPAPAGATAEHDEWDGTLPESLQRSLNALRFELPTAVVNGVEHEVRSTFKAMHISLTTAKRMYGAACDRLEALEAAQPLPDPFATPQPAPAAGVTVEQVEDAIGLQSTAWDTIGAEKIVEAVLRLTNGQAPATQQAVEVVAYLDIGAGGYLDLGSELSDEALQQLPKGRHALVIAGTYGIDGYVAAPQPSPTAQAAPAAGAVAGPDDYTPLLDDEGRMMVGTSHHYTAENIRALVAEYKALEAGGPDTWELHYNTDHRARAGVLWRVISALADEVPFAAAPTPPAQAADSVLEDAARYRWLREWSSTMFVKISINGEGAEIAETLDSAVDAARKQGANHD